MYIPGDLGCSCCDWGACGWVVDVGVSTASEPDGVSSPVLEAETVSLPDFSSIFCRMLYTWLACRFGIASRCFSTSSPWTSISSWRMVLMVLRGTSFRGTSSATRLFHSEGGHTSKNSAGNMKKKGLAPLFTLPLQIQ